MRKQIYKILFSTGSDSNPGLLLLRVFTGVAMMTHGYSKLFGSLEGLTNAVARIGFPMPIVFAFAAAFSEFFGALFLATGFMTRVWAAFLAFTMFVAAFIVHAGDPFARRELALLFMFVFILYILKGAGKYSVDHIVSKKR